MMKIKTTLVTVAMLTILTPQAEARSFGEIYKECGIGAMIFDETPVAAAISNVIWDLGTTAVSTNISSPEECSVGNGKIAAFIGKSYDDLELEIASGEGKYVDTLATMTTKDISDIRSEFAELVASNDYESMDKVKKIEKLYNIVTM